MSERKPCIRCERQIDEWAKFCPFCNWDQSQSAAAAAAQPQPVIDYKPPEETRLKKRLLMGVGGALLLVASFGIGTVINSDDAPDEAPPTVEEQQAAEAAVPPPLRANTPLVPANSPQAQTPITTAPAAAPQDGVPNEYARHDATAVSSDEYRALAARAAEEERKRNLNTLVDPRSITGRAYAPPPIPVRRVAARTQQPAPAAPQGGRPSAASKVTRPVPEHQPVPDVRVSSNTTVRLQLLVGADGRVREVSIRDGLPGQNARIISAVQRWKFRPARANGVPVESPYNVEIWFKADD